MNKNRLEAFSDGVLAIIITIMVLELKIPHGHEFKDLKPLLPVLGSYILSFIYIGIYWSNHHHTFQVATKVNGKVLWANLYLLFWLSLVPFATSWMGETEFGYNSVALYGFMLLMASLAYYLLDYFLIKINGKDSVLAKSLGSRYKETISPIIYYRHYPGFFCAINFCFALCYSCYYVVFT
ncbi:TMEM175 family protein [Pedobacter psychrophilus]|uniref:TMEM175 family protein n=1 Tax=Pedobacter psychrophilus TaxID=1826909 RepID=UPI000AFE3B19|nr:TMEM175 family protein [Pedobacter psychrophilus]